MSSARAGHSVEPVALENGAHPLVGLDGDDAHAERRDGARQLARAGTELDDEPCVLGHEPPRRLGRPLRPRALIGVGVGAKCQATRRLIHPTNVLLSFDLARTGKRIGGINATSGHLRWGRYASGPSGAFPSAPGDA
jgi:hypothetical protein